MINKTLTGKDFLALGNILLGIGYIAYESWFLFSARPSLQGVFDGFGQAAPNQIPVYVIAAIFILLGLFDIYIGVNLYRSKKSEPYFKMNLISFVVSCLGIGVLTALNVILVVVPIYNLTNSL